MDLTILNSALIGSIAGSLLTFIITFFQDSVRFKREMKKQTHLRILEKAEKAVGYHFTYYTKLIEMQKVFEVMKGALDEYQNKAEGLEAIFPKLQEVSLIISKLQNDYQIEANSIFLYIESNVFNDWYDNKIEELTNCLVQFKANQNAFEESLAQYMQYVGMEWTQQDDAWKNVIKYAGSMQLDIDNILVVLKEYIQISKDIVTEIRVKVPRKHLKI
ncbi:MULTISPECIES: hypothetical protein [Sphingobacterium]|uniref:hypothetical protein n=1 Tax=Sphingobacterium TaxID=28453 RepID=UPI0013DA841D|nr:MULTISPECIES: hypothetical protein [unclassified Sphingobacterium]